MIMVVALVFLGPSKLPELARGLGKGLREFRRATDDFKQQFDEEAYRPEAKRLAPTPPAGTLSASDLKPSEALPVDAKVEPIPSSEKKADA